MNAETQRSREARPRWARTIHDLGDDLNWAISAWCDFPRPVGRVVTAVLTTAGGHALGVGEVVAAIAQSIGD